MPRKTNAQIAAEVAASQKAETAAMIAAANKELMAQFAAMLGANPTSTPTPDTAKSDKGTKGRTRGNAPEKPANAPVPTNLPITADTIAHYGELTEGTTRGNRKFNARYAKAPTVVGKHLVGPDGADKHLVRISALKGMWGENKGQYLAQGDVTYTAQELDAFIAALQAARKLL